MTAGATPAPAQNVSLSLAPASAGFRYSNAFAASILAATAGGAPTQSMLDAWLADQPNSQALSQALQDPSQWIDGTSADGSPASYVTVSNAASAIVFLTAVPPSPAPAASPSGTSSAATNVRVAWNVTATMGTHQAQFFSNLITFTTNEIAGGAAGGLAYALVNVVIGAFRKFLSALAARSSATVAAEVFTGTQTVQFGGGTYQVEMAPLQVQDLDNQAADAGDSSIVAEPPTSGPRNFEPPESEAAVPGAGGLAQGAATDAAAAAESTALLAGQFALRLGGYMALAYLIGMAIQNFVLKAFTIVVNIYNVTGLTLNITAQYQTNIVSDQIPPGTSTLMPVAQLGTSVVSGTAATDPLISASTIVFQNDIEIAATTGVVLQIANAAGGALQNVVVTLKVPYDGSNQMAAAFNVTSTDWEAIYDSSGAAVLSAQGSLGIYTYYLSTNALTGAPNDQYVFNIVIADTQNYSQLQQFAQSQT